MLHDHALREAALRDLERGRQANDHDLADGALTRLEQASQRLETVWAEHRRWEQRYGRELPALEAFTRREQGRER